ncbi:hypothetical protein K7X08_015283 [Anisodus acutangulus]|uniref:Uncharacterized protein n=1 Tax=Anisodus acutangulus TaxID=402998 RepID=A0A9Q1L231_9SOLA|nr:hypothetical protein K7X08_015283 [Anisodus acutangulus]
MTYKTQQFTDLEEKFGNQISSIPEKKPDIRRQKMQDDSSDLDDAPPRKTLPNPKKSAGTEKSIREGMISETNKITEKGQEREANNPESDMSWSSQEVPTKTAASKVNRVSKDARNKKPDETTQSQDEAAYQKPNSIAQAEEKNNTVFRDTEQRLAGDLKSSSTHVKTAEMALEDNNLDTENDMETDEDHTKSSAANLDEEGKDMD